MPMPSNRAIIPPHLSRHIHTPLAIPTATTPAIPANIPAIKTAISAMPHAPYHSPVLPKQPHNPLKKSALAPAIPPHPPLRQDLRQTFRQKIGNDSGNIFGNHIASQPAHSHLFPVRAGGLCGGPKAWFQPPAVPRQDLRQTSRQQNRQYSPSPLPSPHVPSPAHGGGVAAGRGGGFLSPLASHESTTRKCAILDKKTKHRQKRQSPLTLHPTPQYAMLPPLQPLQRGIAL